jgi:hypothetical protein
MSIWIALGMKLVKVAKRLGKKYNKILFWVLKCLK